MEQLLNVCNEAIASMPQPRQSAENSESEREFWNGRDEQRIFLGGMRMSYGSIGCSELTISARTLLDLLSGRLSYQRFSESYFRNGQLNPLEQNRSFGRMIISANVERLPNEDDDLITFKFGPPDPAVWAFTTPRTQKDGDS